MGSSMWNTRRRIQMYLIVFVLVLAASCYNAPAKGHWSSGGWTAGNPDVELGGTTLGFISFAILQMITLMVDFMFLDHPSGTEYKYDPTYKNWERQTDPKY